MSPKDLRTYLAELARTGDLVDVDREVRLDHELSAVAKLTENAGAPAVRFNQVQGHLMPVVTALFGTRERVARALGVAAEAAVEHVLAVMDGAESCPPQTVDRADAPVQQVVLTEEQASLDVLPIGVHSAQDAGRYLTSAVTVVRDPATGAINTGIYRLMVDGSGHLTVNAAPNHDLGRIMRETRGADVPIAVVVGHHPAYLVASQLKNPLAVDTHDLAGRLLGEPLRTVRATSIDLPVPADAEIVIEAVIHTADVVAEGPFGEFTYYYGNALAPRAVVTAITHRTDAIFHDLHPTHAEHRCLWLYPGREARLLAAVRRSVPGATAVRIPFAGGALSAYVSISKSHESDGQQAVLAAFAADHFLKHVYVVDTDVDIFDDQQVLWALNVRFQPGGDLVQLHKAKGIRMDPSAPTVTKDGRLQAMTGKLGFDATMPITIDFPRRADEVPDGFADLSLADWLAPKQAARLASVLDVRGSLAE